VILPVAVQDGKIGSRKLVTDAAPTAEDALAKAGEAPVEEPSDVLRKL
jgi:hypothetical protein